MNLKLVNQLNQKLSLGNSNTMIARRDGAFAHIYIYIYIQMLVDTFYLYAELCRLPWSYRTSTGSCPLPRWNLGTSMFGFGSVMYSKWDRKVTLWSNAMAMHKDDFRTACSVLDRWSTVHRIEMPWCDRTQWPFTKNSFRTATRQSEASRGVLSCRTQLCGLLERAVTEQAKRNGSVLPKGFHALGEK